MGWYRKQLTPEWCSYDDAALIRLHTIERCRNIRTRSRLLTAIQAEPRTPLYPVDSKHLIDDGKATWQDHASGLCLVGVLVAAFLLYWWMSPTDRELQDINYGRPTSSAVSR